VVFSMTVVALSGLIWLFNLSGIGWAQGLGARFLPPSHLLVLGLGLGAIHIVQCLALYIRAHKRDPLLGILVAGNTLIGLLVFGLGALYGPLAAGWGFTTVALTVTLPGVAWIWRSERQRRIATSIEIQPKS
jgi:hypothetical protein